MQPQREQRKQRRRALRQQMTSAEARLWAMLRNRRLRGRRFRRQHSAGPFILDFYCMEERLAVELDGAPHSNPARRTYDDERPAVLAAHGIRVVRFENRLVFEQPDVVLAAIAACFGDTNHSPPENGGRPREIARFPKEAGRGATDGLT